MSVTCLFQGRLANNIYQAAHVISYALKNNLTYFIPDISGHTATGRLGFKIQSTGDPSFRPAHYIEPVNQNGNPYYHDIPVMDNRMFVGYWQSFRYIDEYRDTIMNLLKVPYTPLGGVVAVHVRRGDYVVHPNDFPPLPLDYYKVAIRQFQEKGYNRFIVFSDDIPWCEQFFTPVYFPDCIFEFSKGNNEWNDLALLSSCEHQITANSSFSFMAAWLNQNPDKIVLCPDEQHLFRGHNLDYIPDYYTRVII